jgi:hypothetical protein
MTRAAMGLGRAARGVAVLAAVAAGAGCSDNGPAPSLSRRTSGYPARGPVQPAPTHAGPLPEMTESVEHSPLTLTAPLPAGTVVDAHVLVISADGTDSELEAIEQTLGYLGTPFDVIIANQAPALTAAQLGTSTHGKYNAVVLTRGNLMLPNGTSAFTSAEFQTLATYEASFQVRRVSLYTSPDAGYGSGARRAQGAAPAPAR